MITHVFVTKLKNRNEETISNVKNKLLGMKGKIEHLKDLSVGVDFTHAQISYDIAMVAQFNSKEDFNAYIAHPAHLEVARYIFGVQEKVVTVNYEI
ncbi:Dabb family protein [Paenibacillus albidus]|uniref:Dabb family protein n=1 Tax=Paenibacillus albidus TaxID=2041023 RepID=UPI001BE9B245|nr:Dabb family protein [Paenibacillus albidus]MBT2291467.1 Dabb family protein [Paenibacillus albidus]